MKKDEIVYRVIDLYLEIGTIIKVHGEHYTVISRRLIEKEHYSKPYEYNYELKLRIRS
jgi:hypothetical protein